MKMVKEALTEIEPVKIFILEVRLPKRRLPKRFTFLRVYPKTGRTHQIRVHLASIGHPVVGDKLYGGKKRKSFGLTRHFLHASSLEFSTPNSRRIKVESDLPRELQRILSSLS